MARNLVANIDDLGSYRSSEIKEVVKDAFKEPRRILINQIHQSGKLCFVISYRHINSQELHEYDFQTRSNNIRGSYFEIWNQDGRDNYYLSKAYLHLHRVDKEYIAGKPGGEYILLHCDPNDNDDHGDYKRSPHLHFENAGFPINKAHIALNMSNINQILASRDELNIALKAAVLMLNKQILERL